MKKNADGAGRFPTFREWLTAIDDELLGEIITHRPDIVVPDAPGFTTLAGRLRTPTRVLAALKEVDAPALLTLEAAARLGGELTPVSLAEVIKRITSTTQDSPSGSPEPETLEEAFRTLRAYALVYGDADSFMVVPEAMSSLPLDWQLLPEPGVPMPTYEEAAEFIANSGTRCQRILDTLLESGGGGVTKDADPDADPTRPVPKLLTAGLLRRQDSHTVRLAQVTKRVLWDLGPLHIPFTATHLERTLSQAELAQADEQAAANGLEVVRYFRLLIEYLTENPASCVQRGALGVRVVQRMAKHLQVDTLTVCRLVCLGEETQMLSRGTPEPPPENNTYNDYLCPTNLATQWLRLDLHEQWADLARNWLTSRWMPWLVKKPIQLLAESTYRYSLHTDKKILLRQYAHRGQLTPDQALSMAAFESPLYAHQIHAANHIIEEAIWLGILSPDHRPTNLAVALVDAPEKLVAAAKQATPQAVDYLIAQGDMTILAPGPLTAQLRQQLELIAEVESAGLASVYRISEASLHRAMDAGMGAGDITELLEKHIVGEVPQALSYLLTDLARQYGSLRGGPVMCYLRSDDEALLEQAVQAIPALRLLAPTVAVSKLPLGSMIETLRRNGFKPLAEDSHGVALDLRPPPRRVPTYVTPEPVEEPQRPDVRKIIQRIRANELKTVTEGESTRSTAEILAVLQAAVRSGTRVTLGFVDKHGIATARVVLPLTVSGGQVDAIEETSGAVHRYQLHRITTVVVDN